MSELIKILYLLIPSVNVFIKRIIRENNCLYIWADFYEYREYQDEAAAMLLSKHIWKLLKKARHRLSQVCLDIYFNFKYISIHFAQNIYLDNKPSN